MPPPFTDCAARAARLRRDGAEVTLVTGCVLGPSARGHLPGDTLGEQCGHPLRNPLTRR
ncbi:hypothetical protein [Streptomyces mirabilis]|jgi:hypothetical protein|uniref:hypothetical protein n=1 Tax=Streptomyces mirabilis TaxID=68239 RepID=UPI00167CB975|nr:hypothetical protein [Streptomyces mirabilis]